MQTSAEMRYDAASALSLGKRDEQEDAIAADFPVDSGHGFAILSDGMGGHAAGSIASNIVVTEMFSELKMLANDPAGLEMHIHQTLNQAVLGANDCINQYSSENPETGGMGATLVAPILFGDRLYWISIGDSPLYLYRDGQLARLNEDHSVASQIEMMCRKGLMSVAEAAAHPDKHCLTSVLAGQDIPQIDCRGVPVRVRDGDIIIAASDGLLFLSDGQLSRILNKVRHKTSAEIVATLMRAVEMLNDPYQDNTSLCVIKLLHADARRRDMPSQPNSKPAEAGEDRRRASRSVTIVARKRGAAPGMVYCASKEGTA